ncbi:radical SAM protein [Oscillospiraceae bacterium LTW-04]|nr:radical SAM protein [Oscillospiraceae bacterium MB24-C1]
MRYEGDVYRPPSEAHSLIIQLTIGCARNTCTFCTMYKRKTFRVRPLADVIADLEEVSQSHRLDVDRIFLADGDALVVKTEDIITILDKAYALFPRLERITMYGAAQDVLLKSHEELVSLREHGLEMVYIGAESGSDEILQDVKKGVTAAEITEACLRLKAAGLKVSMTLITGLGGRPKTREHAIMSAKLVTATKPDYLGLLTLHLEAGTPLAQDYLEGRFDILSPLEYLQEQKLFLESVDSEGTVLRSNHISNYVALAGVLNRDRQKMINQLQHALENGKIRPERYRRL